MAPPRRDPAVYPPQVFDCRSLFVDKGDEWGFPRGASILITGTPGAGKSFLALALARGMFFSGKPKPNHIRSEHVLYFISAELDRDRMERNFKATDWFHKDDPLFGGDGSNPDRRFSLISARVDLGRPVPTSEELVNGLLVELRERHANRPPNTSAFVIVDSLTALLRDCSDRGEERRQTHEFIRRLETALGRDNLALTLFITEEGADHAATVNVEDYVVDFVIHLGLDKAAGGRRSRTLEVIKSHGAYLRIGLHSWAIVTGEGVDGVIAVRKLADAIQKLALGELNIDDIYKLEAVASAPSEAEAVASVPSEAEAVASAPSVQWATVAIFASGAFRAIGHLQDTTPKGPSEVPISSGIPGLDYMLEYSTEGREYWTRNELGIEDKTEDLEDFPAFLPKRSTTVISGLAGAGKTNMCLQFLVADQGQEDRSLFVNFELPIPDVIARFPHEDSRERFKPVQSLFRRRGNLDINLLLAEVRFIVRRHKIERIAIDGLSSLLATTRQEEYAQLIERLLSTLADLSSEVTHDGQVVEIGSVLAADHADLAALARKVVAAAQRIATAKNETQATAREHKALVTVVDERKLASNLASDRRSEVLHTALVKALKQLPSPTHPITIFITYEPPGGGDTVGSAEGLHMEIPRLSAMADNILVIRPVMIEDEVRQAIYLAKVRGSNHDRTVRQVRVQRGRRPVRVGPGLESYTGVLTGKPEPVRLTLQLFYENHAEERYNQHLEKRLNEVFKFAVGIFGFSRTAISRTVRELLAPELRFPASHVRVLTIDEWVVQDIDRSPKKAARRPLLPLFPFDARKPSAPDNPLNTRSSDFWAWDIAKCRLLDSPNNDLVALPLSADYGMFCINARLAKDLQMPGFDKVDFKSGHEGDKARTQHGPEWDKSDTARLEKFDRDKAWQEIPYQWAHLTKDGWFQKPNPAQPNVLVDYMSKVIEEKATTGGDGKPVWGFTFDLATPETAAVFFLELCWSFGATEEIFVLDPLHPLKRDQNLKAGRWALRFLMYLVKEGLMPPEPTIYRSDIALFSRHFYSTFTDCIAPPPDDDAKRPAAPLVILPFFPFNAADSGPIEEDIKHRLGKIADEILKLPYGQNTGAHYPFSALPPKPESNQAADWKAFEVQDKREPSQKKAHEKPEASPEAGAATSDEQIHQAAANGPASAPTGETPAGAEAQTNAEPKMTEPPLTPEAPPESPSPKTPPSDADWHDTVEFFRRHGRRVELKEKRPAGFSCTGLWMVAVHEHTHSAGLSCKLVDEMVSLGSVVERAREGAGMPARKDFYHFHGADRVPNAPYLTWRELLTDCCSRARQRQRAVGPRTQVRKMNEILHEIMRAAIQVAALQGKDALDRDTSRLADAFANQVFDRMDRADPRHALTTCCMDESNQRVCIIGFERKDEALIRFYKDDATGNELAHQIIDLPGCASLTKAIFDAAELSPHLVPLVRLGRIGRPWQVELQFDKAGHLRPKQWVARGSRKNEIEDHQPPDGDYGAILAQLRWSDAWESFPREGRPLQNGLEVFCERVTKFEDENRMKTKAMFYMLGILPGPSWPSDVSLADLVNKSKAPQKILFTNAQAFRDSGYRVREDGSTSAAVEDLCGVVLAATEGAPGPASSNLTENDRKIAAEFFSEFTQVYIRIRCDSMLVFTRKKVATEPEGKRPNPKEPEAEWEVRLYYVIEGDRQKWFRYGDHIFGLNAIIAAVLITHLRGMSSGSTIVPDAIREGICRAWSLVERGYSVHKEPTKWTELTDLCMKDAWKLWDPLGNEKGEWTETLKEAKKPEKRAVPKLSEECAYVKRLSVLIGKRPEVSSATEKQHREIAEHQLYEVRSRVRDVPINCSAHANILRRNRWTFFREVCLYAWDPKRGKKRNEEAELWVKLPNRITREGPEKARLEGKTLKWPYRVFQLGKVRSVDREEIDGLISLQRLIVTYFHACLHRENRPEHPLCVGVFGAPGSGKSFGVKQIARSLRDWEQPVPSELLEFNVAQFSSTDDLATALHKVRDLNLETNKVPVAIFDEFDAEFSGRPFGWLRYFLMPMHDGKFVDRKDTYHTGNAVFIFAGGINHSFGEFSSRQRDRNFCDAKGPDFISRLRGIHNVPPLNRPANSQENRPANSRDGDFPNWKIRRAILLHGYLKKHEVEIADDALLGALLEVTAYHHGARSLGALIEMCARSHGKVLGRASLPPRDQLDLHVDAQEFWDLLRRHAGAGLPPPI